ncbi:MAG: matrixin family metalloprotease [Phycisphaerales bacterium]|nr:matrixin family metalloprotease [Phycisphaerales bacterium]
MRCGVIGLTALIVPLWGLGCTPLAPFDNKDAALVLGAQTVGDVSEGDVAVVEGYVSANDYRVYAVGPAEQGSTWSVTAELGLSVNSFIVVLLDEKENMLARASLSSGGTLTHILREHVEELRVGVMAPAGRSGGFQFRVRNRGPKAIPTPARQVIWLNFGSGSGVRVQQRTPISFEAFDARILGSAYADKTDEIRNRVVEMVREDYAAYDVDIRSSNEEPMPAGAVSVAHFGGYQSDLLGLADNVDGYNSDPTQTAVIYIDGFARYAVMELTPEQMASMIANVASHEIGHLLGLYHTQETDDVMDTTGSAWELAGLQAFKRARVEDSVFGFAMQDTPALLSQIVGASAAAKSGTLKARSARPMTAGFDACHMCGTCQDIAAGIE